ncbi:MAG: DNA repair protein RecO [Candidatus Paceibacterota bacterium]
MAHELHHTEGFILASYDLKEADSLLRILTGDFGLVLVQARGLRKLPSKLRYHATLFNQADISLVRGREVWRLVAVNEAAVMARLRRDPAKWRIYLDILALLRRFFHGEEENQILFNDLKSGFLWLANEADQVELQKNFECVLVLRILKQLGYLADVADLRPFIDFIDWSGDIVGQMADYRPTALSLINRSFQAATV